MVYAGADSQKVHLKVNLVEIIRMVKSQGKRLVDDGVTVRPIRFEFNEKGVLSIAGRNRV